MFWNKYSKENQTISCLSKNFNISKRSVQRILDESNESIIFSIPKKAVVVTDTSYYGNLGIMVFRDIHLKKNIIWKFIPHETLRDYVKGIYSIKQMGCEIKGIVCDGKRGMFHAFGNIPVQMCQFHQTLIVARYITKNPKLEAGKELKNVMYLLTRSDKESFIGALNEWHDKWKDFLAEKTIDNDTNNWHYTHKRIRSAYRSLITNLPYLFIWYDYPELKIPNTTNSLEGVFTNIKTKLRVHCGLKQWRKIKLINELLSR